uniref:Prolamin-like domain-containing protein n=2 Tax=Aegilops tauschii TaxID=37682 RepID=A0A453M153_AEGTS
MASKTAVVAFILIAAQLLLASTPTTAISIPPATTTGTTTVPSGSATDVPVLPFPGEGEVAEAAADCWKVVLQAESCAVDILKWLASRQLAGRVSLACCGVLQRVGDRCLRDLFPHSAVGRLYAPFVSHACGIPKRATTPNGRQ